MLTMKLHTNHLTLALGGLALAWMTGCQGVVESETDEVALDGQSAFLASEVDQMGASLSGLPGEALAKSARTEADTVTTEKIVERYAFNEGCGCFIRRATFTSSTGYERERIDSVTLLDSAGQTLSNWRPLKIAKILHKRHVLRSKGSHDIDVHFNTEAVFKMDNGQRVGVWNGTMSGAYDGEAFKSGTVDQVTRVFSIGGFGFPVSGSVTVTRPLRIYTVTFLGGGDAEATVTNRRTGKVTVITIDRNYSEKEKKG